MILDIDLISSLLRKPWLQVSLSHQRDAEPLDGPRAAIVENETLQRSGREMESRAS
jgi:hypothetical protein